MRLLETNVKVTIGLCVKNSGRTIKNAVNSIINQDFPKEDVRLVVVDGCSTDGTISIMKEVASKAQINVDFYTDEGKGLGAARQLAVNNAEGKYLIFVDGDVELFKDFVREQVKFMEQNPEVGISVGKYEFKEGPLISSVWNLFLCMGDNTVGGGSTIFRLKALRQAGGFDKKIKGAGEDLDLIERMQKNGWLLCSNKKARFLHNFRENLVDFWAEQTWFGYGEHLFSHKKSASYSLLNSLPIISFYLGLKIGSKAYRSTLRKISFLMPFQLFYAKTAWWLGFAKSHLDGYGHEFS